MAIRFPGFLPVVTRSTETPSAPAAQPASAAPSSELFSDGFSSNVSSPLSFGGVSFSSLGAGSPSMPAFRVSPLGVPMPAPEAPEAAAEKSALASTAEGVDVAHTGFEQLNDVREAGVDFNDGKALALGTLDGQAAQYERVLPNLTGPRQAAAQDILDTVNASRSDIAAFDGSNVQRAGSLLEDLPGASALRFVDTPLVKGVGIAASAVNAAEEGQKLYDNGDSLASSEAGGVASFGVGTLPGTQGLGAFDTLSKAGVGYLGSKLGTGEASESIYGRGPFSDTGVDGARAAVNLTDAAITGDTSGLEHFRDTLSNGSLLERTYAAGGDLLAGGIASITQLSLTPLKEAGSDIYNMFSTLGQKPEAPVAAAPVTAAPALVAPSPAAEAPQPLPELQPITVSATRLPPEETSNPFSNVDSSVSEAPSYEAEPAPSYDAEPAPSYDAEPAPSFDAEPAPSFDDGGGDFGGGFGD